MDARSCGHDSPMRHRCSSRRRERRSCWC
jgi:hypothetical protein